MKSMRDEPAAVVLGDVVDAHDVRTGHLPRQQQFLAETLERFGLAREFRAQQLDGDVDIERLIAAAIDHAHAADAEHRDDAEPVGEDVARRATRTDRVAPSSSPNRCPVRPLSGPRHWTCAHDSAFWPARAYRKIHALTANATRPSAARRRRAARLSSLTSPCRCPTATMCAACCATLSISSRSSSVTGGPGRRLST